MALLFPERAMPSFILTYDLGTTACKTEIFDLQGRILAEASQGYPTYRPDPLTAEQDPENWWTAVVATTHNCLAALEARGHSARDLAAIGLSSQREGVVPLEADGRKLGDCILWMDQRAQPQAEAMARDLGRERIHRITGKIPNAMYTAAKLLWLREHQPDLFQRAVAFLQPKNYLCYRLTDVLANDYSLASVTMLLDVANRTWWEEAFDYVGLRPEQFPPNHFSDEVVGHVTPAAAAILGLPSGLPVVIGAGDRPCEATGAGVSAPPLSPSPRRAMESSGTTTNVACASAEPIQDLDPRVLCSIHALRDQWLIEQGLTASGSLVQWCCEQFYREAADPYAAFDAEASARPAGSQGTLLLPFFAGARATRWNPQAHGVFFGLTLAHERGDLARSILEGVAFEIRACLRILQGMGLIPDEIVLLGGGAGSSLWNRLKASVLQRPLHRPRVTEAASLGAMILAATGIGAIEDPGQAARELNPLVETFSPHPGEAAVYAELEPLYEQLYEQLEPVFAAHGQE